MTTSPPMRSRRRPPLWFIGGLIPLGVVLAILIYYQVAPLEAPIPAGAGAAIASLPSGITAQGFPRLGRADAPVLVEEFSSYACPHCLDFHKERFPRLLGAIAGGHVQIVFIPVPHIGPGAKTAAAALFCAGDQGHLWEMHETLFYWQERFLTRTFDRRRILKGAEALGLDRPAFAACLDAAQTTARIEAARQEFSRRGLRGTPTFFIDGVQVRDYREFEPLYALAE